MIERKTSGGKKQPAPRLHIIMVLYNRRIEDIASLPEFEYLQEKHPDVNLIVADNSTDEVMLEHNRETASVKEHLRYIECGGNIGLSRAYNRALATIPGTEPFWVMLADDDTQFSEEYLENGYRQIMREAALAEQMSRGRACRREALHVLCGVVETGSGWISPRTEYSKEMVFSAFLKRPVPGIYQDLYPINSGIFLEGKVIETVAGFDERLFLDQVDFLMMDRLRSRGIRRIGVLPGKISQSFSGDIGAGQTSKSRWEIFRKDFLTYCELTDKPWCYRAYILGRRRLMLEVQSFLAGLGN